MVASDSDYLKPLDPGTMHSLLLQDGMVFETMYGKGFSMYSNHLQLLVTLFSQGTPFFPTEYATQLINYGCITCKIAAVLENLLVMVVSQ